MNDLDNIYTDDIIIISSIPGFNKHVIIQLDMLSWLAYATKSIFNSFPDTSFTSMPICANINILMHFEVGPFQSDLYNGQLPESDGWYGLIML